MNIVLASKSPRRKELLQMMGLSFIIDPSEIDEKIDMYHSPSDYVKKISIIKNKDISKKHPLDLVISADTIVVVDEEIIGKPHSKEEAYQMIKKISGRSHFVLTGVTIYYQNKYQTFVSKTKVFISRLTDKEIYDYIETTEPYDKAGAYAIQGIFGKYIEKIEGDFYNVMGLPINKVYQKIKKCFI